MNVTVVWATPQVQDAVAVDLPPGATVADALVRSGLVVVHGLDPATLGYAVFGLRATAGTRLSDGDRVELTRPLVADPKAARARRAREKPLAETVRRGTRARGG